MQLKLTTPSTLRAQIELPASKSISNRALIISALGHGGDKPQNVSDCDDTNVMARALSVPDGVIDIMAAGTAMRFLTAYLAVTPGCRTITGTERMKHRPIGVLVEALRTLGAKVDYVGEEGFPPLRITGGAHEGGEVLLPGNVSSQYISALLMIGPCLRRGLTLRLTGDIVSRPYIDLTLKLMADFGAQAAWTTERSISVQPTSYRPTPYTIENDWSAASYWYEMVALSGDGEAAVRLPGLFRQSFQGDAAVRQIFEPLGVGTEFLSDNEVRIFKKAVAASATPYIYDFVNQPDLAQTVVVTCAMLGRPFRFVGLQSLKIKETDRLNALVVELRKLGFVLREEGGSALSWDGERCEAAATPVIDTYEDHRMAMAFAPCCLVRPSICINHPQVVSKSYPHYWDDLRRAGFNLTETNE